MTTAVVEKSTNGTPSNSKPKSELSTVKGWLQSDAFKDEIARALPKHMTADRFLRIAITATLKTPKLLRCSQESLFECLLNLSQMGLEPDGRRAYLIPYENKKAGTVVCTLIVDYKGLAELVMRSGLVSSIHADVICENDEFEYDRGFITRHKIDFRKDRGEAYAAYAVIRFKDGTEKTEVMPRKDILAIRDRGQGWQAFVKKYTNQSPWNPLEPVIEYEMWKKTVFRRASKWVPLSPEIRDAIAAEDDVDDEKIRIITNADEVVDGQSKSDALAAMLSKRLSSQEAEESHQREEEVVETKKPQSHFAACVETLASLPVKVQEVQTDNEYGEWALPDGSLLVIAKTGQLPKVADGEPTSVVDCLEPDCVEQVKAIVERAGRKAR